MEPRNTDYVGKAIYRGSFALTIRVVYCANPIVRGEWLGSVQYRQNKVRKCVTEIVYESIKLAKLKKLHFVTALMWIYGGCENY